MKKNNNDFSALIDELKNENQSFKQLYEEYKQEKAIIEKIVKSRKKQNLSQRDLAKLTGLKQPAIARFETLEATPNLDTLLKIINALGLKIEIKDQCDSSGVTFYNIATFIHPSIETSTDNFIDYRIKKGDKDDEYYQDSI